MLEEEKKLKAAIEALLFATNGLTVDEISKRIDVTRGKAKQLLEELELEHLEDTKGIQIIQDGDIWKMSVKPEMTPQVRDILPPEFPKAIIKTLAIIAAKKPVKQSVVVRMRGNKAYDHVKKLEKLGLITSFKQGSTKILDLTEKFFNYFHFNESELKDKFNLNPEKEKAIENSEVAVKVEEKKEQEKANLEQ